MAKGILQTFQSGIGDCIFLRLENEGKAYTIMVDCGKMTPEIKDFIIDELHRHIDLLIITHIDNDHIVGVEKIIRKIDGLEIGSILYNCAQKCGFENGRTLPKEILENIKVKVNTTGIQQYVKQDISAEKAFTLAESILKSEELKIAWEKQNDYITDEYPSMSLPDEFGIISFLSPQRQSIEKLDREFRKAFTAKSYAVYEGPYDIEPSLYEMLLRNIESNMINKQIISTQKATEKNVLDLAKSNYITDTSDSNESCIAFVWECNGKRILFCGDASPEVITCNLLKKYDIIDEKLTFEAIKVSHHGSKHSIGRMFWDTVDSEHLFICGASERYGTPSKECFSKIVGRKTDVIRKIHCTTRSKAMDWINDDDVKRKFGFEIDNICRYEFEY